MACGPRWQLLPPTLTLCTPPHTHHMQITPGSGFPAPPTPPAPPPRPPMPPAPPVLVNGTIVEAAFYVLQKITSIDQLVRMVVVLVCDGGGVTSWCVWWCWCGMVVA